MDSSQLWIALGGQAITAGVIIGGVALAAGRMQAKQDAALARLDGLVSNVARLFVRVDEIAGKVAAEGVRGERQETIEERLNELRESFAQLKGENTADHKATTEAVQRLTHRTDNLVSQVSHLASGGAGRLQTFDDRASA